MKTWEHLVKILPFGPGSPDNEIHLNNLGMMGWELIAVVPGIARARISPTSVGAVTEVEHVAYFKREIEKLVS